MPLKHSATAFSPTPAARRANAGAPEDFSVEIHALAHVFFAHHRKRRSGRGVKAEAAHAAVYVGGAGVDHIPKIGDFCARKGALWGASLPYSSASRHTTASGCAAAALIGL